MFDTAESGDFFFVLSDIGTTVPTDGRALTDPESLLAGLSDLIRTLKLLLTPDGRLTLAKNRKTNITGRPECRLTD